MLLLEMDDRNKNLNVRVSDAELAVMHAAAEAAGLTLSAWVRTTLVKAAKKATK